MINNFIKPEDPNGKTLQGEMSGIASQFAIEIRLLAIHSNFGIAISCDAKIKPPLKSHLRV